LRSSDAYRLKKESLVKFFWWEQFAETMKSGLPFPRGILGPLRGYVSIRSTHCARQALASKGSAKYWVSRATLPPLNSMMLTV
jgi:hypothetical protein